MAAPALLLLLLLLLPGLALLLPRAWLRGAAAAVAGAVEAAMLRRRRAAAAPAAGDHELLLWHPFDVCQFMPRLPLRWRLLLRAFTHNVVCRPSNDKSLGLEAWRRGELDRWALRFPVLTVFDAPGAAREGEGFLEWPLFDIFKIPLSGLTDWESYLAALPHAERRKVRQRAKLFASFETSGQLTCRRVLLGPAAFAQPSPGTKQPAVTAPAGAAGGDSLVAAPASPFLTSGSALLASGSPEPCTPRPRSPATGDGTTTGPGTAVCSAAPSFRARSFTSTSSAGSSSCRAEGREIDPPVGTEGGSSSTTSTPTSTPASTPRARPSAAPAAPASGQASSGGKALRAAAGDTDGSRPSGKQLQEPQQRGPQRPASKQKDGNLGQAAQATAHGQGKAGAIKPSKGTSASPSSPLPPASTPASPAEAEALLTAMWALYEETGRRNGLVEVGRTQFEELLRRAPGVQVVVAHEGDRPDGPLQAFGVLLPQAEALQLLYAGLAYDNPLVRQSNAYFQIIFVAVQLALAHNTALQRCPDPASSAASGAETGAEQAPPASGGGEWPLGAPGQLLEFVDLGPGHRFVKEHLGAVGHPLSMYTRGIGPISHALLPRLMGGYLEPGAVVTDV